MENTLELYHQPYNPAEPVVNMDETTKPLTQEVLQPLPAEPGQPERFDTLYQRNGVATIFLFFEPLVGWREVTVNEGQTRQDWAWRVRELLDGHYSAARKVHLVMDNPAPARPGRSG